MRTTRNSTSVPSNAIFKSYYQHFNNFATNQAALTAFQKALEVSPTVVPLPGSDYAYAVARSVEGQWCVVQLAQTEDGGDVEGAICTCPGSSHDYCYHRMAAAMYHIELLDALKKTIGLSVVVPSPAPKPTQPATVPTLRLVRKTTITTTVVEEVATGEETENPAICRETGCEMDSNCPSYPICSKPRNRVAVDLATAPEPPTGPKCSKCQRPVKTQDDICRNGLCISCNEDGLY